MIKYQNIQMKLENETINKFKVGTRQVDKINDGLIKLGRSSNANRSRKIILGKTLMIVWWNQTIKYYSRVDEKKQIKR